jgi:hypothetical protein
MAGDWIKMRGNLWDDPRVTCLVDLTDSSEALVVGALYWLWTTADQHTEDGRMPGLTLRQIDRKTGVQGIGNALVAVGWLEESEGSVTLLHFDEHNGESAKKRCQTAKRVAKHRSGNCDVTPEALPADDTSVTTALAREEKRREEEIPPIPPEGGKPEAPSAQSRQPRQSRKAESPAVGLKAWLAAVKAAGEAAIPDDDPVLSYAAEVGIPSDFLHLAWLEFRARYTQPEAKRYRDWRAVFRKAVRGNWLKLWFIGGDGTYGLTTVGHQAQRANEQRRAA